ncbi:MAG: hypothetical protein ABIN96_16195 [Rubrivivax sp.]
MGIPTSALNLLAFPQRWADGQLTLRYVCLPQGDPLAPLAPGEPAFADAELQFEARVIGSLEHLPRAVDAVAVGPLVPVDPPMQKAALYAELAGLISISGDAPPPAGPVAPRFHKPLTASYRELVGERQLSRWMAAADDYVCALHEGHGAQPAAPVPQRADLRWGEVLAHALRQPLLAAALGLMGELRVPLADPEMLARGGWVYLALVAGSAYAANPALVSALAARLPPLDADRSVYAAVLFPVDGAGVADDAYGEAERYHRGFARLVHATQGDRDGDAIRLAWDDEQLAECYNRQVAADASAAMGTAGYRVDVRDVDGDPDGNGRWHSLQQVASVEDLALGQRVIGAYEGEALVEVAPTQVSNAQPGEFWMPPYFCTWRGSSLVLTDPDLTQLHAALVVDPEFEGTRLNRQQRFVPLGDKDVLLRYGHRYAFRVRLADLSRGGPSPDEATPQDGGRDAHHECEVAFQRHRPPGAVEVLQRPTRDDLRLVIAKPGLGHPEVLYTGVHSFADLEATVADSGARQRAPALPDPDVLQLRITLEVRALRGDRSDWWPLYQTSRSFDGDRMTLSLAPQPIAGLDGFLPLADEGPLPLPAARDLRLVMVAVGRTDAGYFASNDARLGPPVTVELRAVGGEEDGLLVAAPRLTAFYFRDPGVVAGLPRPLPRLAQESALAARGLTLSGRPGARTVFGCATALRHVLAPDAASLTLASDAELNQRWINVLRFDLARDWSWNALAIDGVVIQRRLSRPQQDDVLEMAGTMTLPSAVARDAAGPGDVEAGARAPCRQSSQLVFIDAIDPKPGLRPPGEPVEFPSELTVSYEIAFVLRDGVPAADSATASILLPVTTPPVQVPRLVSAGIALSPHQNAEDYSSTAQRRRMLWLEFEAQPGDPDDAYFVRVLASAADPLLTREALAEVVEPALALDAETVRMIVPGQARDDAGLQAMQPLQLPSGSGAHFLVPLPEGLDADSPELLGLFTYEIRLGHVGARWSTAQGRFGPPLRVAGVQHPPPPLVCQAFRNANEIRVRAPFATPVQDGRHVRPPEGPKTRLWGLLYARVQQADAAAWRNLMLMRVPLRPPPGDLAERQPETAGPLLFGEGQFAVGELQSLLARHGLGTDAPLTTLVVEFHTEPEIDDPLGRQLGHARMLRVSPLIPVPELC